MGREADRLGQLLARHPFVILDGGLATELERCGCDLDDPLWSAKLLLDEDEPHLLEVHRRWLAAGAEVITTASYQATLSGLRARGLSEDQARAALRRSVRLAQRAVADHTQHPHPHPRAVAASIGSYGAHLADGSEYRGGYGLDPASLADFHRPRLLELSAAAPDLLAFETIPDAEEARAIAALLRERPGPRAWVSFSLRPGASAPRLADGTPLEIAAAPLLGIPRVAALGVNCLGPHEVLPALETLAALAPGLPLVAYPNSGERWVAGQWGEGELELATYVALAEGWWRAGARLIGGCCRTRPAHIQALAERRARL
ncbi:homocysteine S-methyltransferase [Pseudenhygromyxa sp. WMMC2535]|nr:homocysteine S-methyltransferase [Pseudenhygromyxa sp. WMMC2535]NVB37415.1 homocysteine S-methyltransferase [Pseudenhygromyxa sp. WMMC2535]